MRTESSKFRIPPYACKQSPKKKRESTCADSRFLSYFLSAFAAGLDSVLLRRTGRLLQHQLRPSQVCVRKPKHKKLIRIRAWPVQVLQEVVVISDPEGVQRR